MTPYESITEEERREPRVHHITHRNLVVSLGAALIGVIVIAFAAYYFGKHNERVELKNLGNAVVAIPTAQSVTPPVKSAAPTKPEFDPADYISTTVYDRDTLSDFCNEVYKNGAPDFYRKAAKYIGKLRQRNNPNYIIVLGQKLYFPRKLFIDGKEIDAVSDIEAQKRWTRRFLNPHKKTAQTSFDTSFEVSNRVPLISMPAESDLALTSRIPVAPLTGNELVFVHTESTDVSTISPLGPQHIAVRANSTGYRMIIPASRAKTMQFNKHTFKHELEVCLVLPDGSQDCTFKAWAQRNHGGIVLSVSILEFPQRTFTMEVANRGKPISIQSDDVLIATAEPIQGHFPGPSRLMAGLGVAKGMAIRGGIGFAIGGPIGGATAAFIPPIAGPIFNHFTREEK